MLNNQQIESVKVMQLQPGDCVVVKINAVLSMAQHESVVKAMQTSVPEGVKFMVLGRDAELEVLRKADAKETA